jgi:hypothetical protein
MTPIDLEDGARLVCSSFCPRLQGVRRDRWFAIRTVSSFDLEFCTVATWSDKGEIAEEWLFYDQVGLMK